MNADAHHETLTRLSSLAGKLEEHGFPMSFFYFNRSRLFLSLTGSNGRVVPHARSKWLLLQFILISSVRLVMSMMIRKTKDYRFAIVDTREAYGAVLDREGGQTYDNVILTNVFSKENWESTLLIDRFNIPNQKFGADSRKQFVQNHHHRPRLYEERILISYLIKHPGSWKTVTREIQKAFRSLGSMNSADQLLIDQLGKCAKTTRFFAWKQRAYEWYFREKLNIKSLLIMDEYSPNQRAIVNACHYSGVTCLALQHGGMHQLHPGYVFGSEDKTLNLFPDAFLTWGTDFSHFLSSHHWPSELVEVGHLRTDTIHSLGAKENRHYRILFATQPHQDETYTENTARLVFKGFAKLDFDAQLLLKPHPRETNITKYKRWAAEENCSIEIVEGELYELLSTTQIVLTAFSTVGQEAIYFNVPLITVDYLDRDIAGYQKEGVASNASTAEALQELIQKVKDDPNGAMGNYPQFITKNAYKIDGKVADRILKVLRSFEPSNR